MSVTDTAAPVTGAPTTPAAPNVQVGADLARAQEIGEIAALATQHNMASRLTDWLKAGRTRNQVADEIMEHYRAANPAITPLAPGDLGLSDKEKKRYSLGRAVLAQISGDWSGAGFEREVSAAVAKKMGVNSRGILVPTAEIDFATRAGRIAMQRAVHATNAAGKGQELVYPEYQGFVDVLRTRAMLLQMGAVAKPGLQGTYSFVRKSAGSTTYWLGQNPGAGVTESDLTMARIEHNPKTLKATLRYTQQQMAQGIESIDQTIKDDLTAEHAVAADRAGLVGDGTSNDPIGVLNATGVNLVALGTNGAVPTYANVVALKTAVNVANAADLSTMGYLITPELQGLFETTPKFANTGTPIMDDGKMAGYRAEATNSLPKTLVKGTSGGVCHAAVFGCFGLMEFLDWGALEILVNPFSEDTKGIVRLTSNQFCDWAFKLPQALSVWKDAKLS